MPLDQVEDRNKLSKEEDDDVRIIVALAENMIDDKGKDIIASALNSKDPGQVIGAFLIQLANFITQNLPEGVTVSPRIWLARGGVLEQVSDYIQENIKVDKAIMDRAEEFVAATLQQQANQQQQQQPPAQPDASQGMPPAQQGAPTLPQGGM